MRVLLRSIGCRLNRSEIETMSRQLVAAGHEIVTDETIADKVIVNSCAVTAAAERDARAITRRIHRINASADVIMTGCYATIAPLEVAELTGVGHVVANRDKDRVVQLIDPQVRPDRTTYEQEPILREYLAGIRGRTRAFVKVQDGCDNKCTFCITTVARGPGWSRPLGDVVAEVQTLASAGYQEAVLTGVHLGSYGHDLVGRFSDRVGLRELVAALLEHTDIARLRLSSLEPWDIAPDFFTLWQNGRLLPHLHIPLQSGSDKILRRMARRTNRAAFCELVNSARTGIPDLNLSTDIIVGFPDETDADFEASLKYVRQIGFGRLHVFSYSSRPGTAAAGMPDQVASHIKKSRVRRMIELGNELSLAFHQSYEGKTRQVLWEANVGADADGLRWSGYSDNYIRVSAGGSDDLFNRVTPVLLSEARPDGMSGRTLIQTQSTNGRIPDGATVQE
jgi:threonylcarbamoyladenosine tRNA methylthiotransferase MtaB